MENYASEDIVAAGARGTPNPKRMRLNVMADDNDQLVADQKIDRAEQGSKI